MKRLLELLGISSRTIRKGKASSRPPSRTSWKPSLDCLEDRMVPATLSTIASNFNGTAIAAGSSVWFNSVMKVSGLGSTPVNIHVSQQTVSFQANGTNYSLNIPDSDITFSPSVMVGTTSFDSSANQWVSSLPSSFSGNAFLGGMTFYAANGLPKGINPVTWSASFTTDTPGVKVNWQWSAAVYTNFSSDYNSLNVKPLDSSSLTIYANSDHAGAPEAFKRFVVGGARGGGGSNYTGSYSATGSTVPGVETVQQLASISGYVTNKSGAPVAGVVITLSGFDANSNAFTMTATTNQNGFYSFTQVPAGVYKVSVTDSPGYVIATGTAGTVAGNVDGTAAFSEITDILLNGGDAGINYNFLLSNPGA